MGNCIDRQRVETWVDDEDWDSVFREEEEAAQGMSSSSSSGEQVKIKMTKKQVERLLGKGMNVEQVVAQILNNGHVCVHGPTQHQWRPALNCIAE